MTILAVTWLNPHVYLDTVVILGSVAGQLAPAGRGWFAGGTISASLVWFYGLALIAVRLAPWLIQPRVQRAIQWLVGIVMWCVALQLLHQGCAYVQSVGRVLGNQCRTPLIQNLSYVFGPRRRDMLATGINVTVKNCK